MIYSKFTRMSILKQRIFIVSACLKSAAGLTHGSHLIIAMYNGNVMLGNFIQKIAGWYVKTFSCFFECLVSVIEKPPDHQMAAGKKDLSTWSMSFQWGTGRKSWECGFWISFEMYGQCTFQDSLLPFQRVIVEFRDMEYFTGISLLWLRFHFIVSVEEDDFLTCGTRQIKYIKIGKSWIIINIIQRGQIITTFGFENVHEDWLAK